MENLFSLEGRVALITGASRGIGEAVAVTLADAGAECILVSRKADSLARVADRIKSQGNKACIMTCNMGDLEAVETLARAIKDQYGALDILVNNAATNPYFGLMEGISPSLWDKTLDVNLKGPFFLIQKTLDLLAASGRGAIINVSSVNGVSPPVNQGVYSITKAGMISMTKGLAKELAPKRIRVNALLPGLTETKLSRALTEDARLLEEACQSIPLGRQAQPREMAGTVLYLASDASTYTTGATIACDGGLLA